MGLFRLRQNDTATISRRTTVGSKQIGNSVIGTYKGFFKPLSANNIPQNLVDFGVVYRFTTDYTADIKMNDLITIDSVEYLVKATAKRRAKKVSELEILCVEKIS